VCSSDLGEALARFNQVRDTLEDLAKQRDDLSFDLANAWGWIAKAHQASGDFDAAIGDQRTKIEVLRRVPDGARNRQVERLLANAEYELGHLELCLGHTAVAAQAARDAVLRFEALSARDTSNMDWLSQATLARLGLAEMLWAHGERDDARVQLQHANADMGRIGAGASRPDWQLRLRGRSLALSAELATQPPKAQDYDGYLATARRFEKGNQELTETIAAVEIRAGDLMASGRQTEAAREYWLSAVTRLTPQADRSELPAMTLLAQALLRMGQAPRARAMADSIERSPYRHPEYADLRQRLLAAAGAATVP